MKAGTAILIINWNGIQETNKCLLSLEKLQGNFTVYLLDNHSKNDELAAIKKKFGHLAWLKFYQAPENLGFVGGNNLLIKKIETSHTSVLLLNNDTTVEPDFLIKLQEASENNPEVGIFGPEVWEGDGSKVQSAGMQINLFTGYTPMLKKVTGQLPYQVDAVSGCAFFITRKCLNTVGLLDERYFTYYEETDFCLQAKRKGFTCMLVPTSKIYHLGGGSAGKISGYTERMLMRNRLWFIQKNGSFIHKISSHLFVALLYVWYRSVICTLRMNPQALKSLWQGFWSGMQGYRKTT
jgi:hypothetical protein